MLAIQYDLEARRMNRLTDVASLTAVRSDLLTDSMYAAIGTDVVSLFSASVARRVGLWRSPIIVRDDQPSLAWLLLEGPVESAIVRIYHDGVLHHTSSPISENEPHRLPAGRFRELQIEIESEHKVSRVYLASSVNELRA